MQKTKMHIRRLCNSTELIILENSMSPRLEKLDSRELKKNIKLIRKLRDKNRDLYQRQTLDSRRVDKGVKVSGLNARTKEKAAVFEVALKIFEARLLKVEPEVKKRNKLSHGKIPARKGRKNNYSAAQEVGKTALNKIGKDQPSRLSGFESRSAQDEAHRQQLQQSYSKPIQGHISSAGKRAQAERDGR